MPEGDHVLVSLNDMLYDTDMLRCLSTHGVYPAFRFQVPERREEVCYALSNDQSAIRLRTPIMWN